MRYIKLKYNRPWLWKRIKRCVAAPDVLYPALKSLFLSFGPLKCSKSGRSLFDKTTWKNACSVLNTVRLGHASDPPGVKLYFKTGHVDDLGLTLYRCIRGTNSLEGGVHQNLIRKFGSFNAGPKLNDAILAEYRLRHNMDVGHANRNKKVYKGHYDPWLLQHIQQLYDELQIVSNYSDVSHLVLRCNALKFVGSLEVYGVCPLPAGETSRLGVLARDVRFMEVADDLTVPKLADTALMKIDSTSLNLAYKNYLLKKSPNLLSTGSRDQLRFLVNPFIKFYRNIDLLKYHEIAEWRAQLEIKYMQNLES